MSTFYVLPPRPLVGEHFAKFLSNMFPGLYWSKDKWHDLAEAMAVAAGACPDVYVIFREDLPETEDTEQALLFLFGAEPGDEIIEVRTEDHLNEWTNRRWRVQQEPPFAA